MVLSPAVQAVSQSVFSQLCSYLSVFSRNFPPFPIVFLADSVFMWLLIPSSSLSSRVLYISRYFCITSSLRSHSYFSLCSQNTPASDGQDPFARCPSVAQSMARSDLLSAGLLSALLPPTPTPTPVPLSLCLPVSFSRLCSAPVSPSFC